MKYFLNFVLLPVEGPSYNKYKSNCSAKYRPFICFWGECNFLILKSCWSDRVVEIPGYQGGLSVVKYWKLIWCNLIRCSALQFVLLLVTNKYSSSTSNFSIKWIENQSLHYVQLLKFSVRFSIYTSKKHTISMTRLSSFP